MRPVNLDVTGRAVGVLRVLIMLRSSRLNGSDVVRHAVAGQTELIDCAESQQPWISGAVWCMAGHATFSFQRGMFISERTLFIRVTFNASCIAADGQSRLFKFEAAVRVMTIAATHRAFQYLVMEGHGECRLHFAVATEAKLRVAHLQHSYRRESRFLSICRGDPCDRAGNILIACGQVWRVAVSAADVVAPMLTTTEVVVLFFAGVTPQTGLSGFLRRLVLKGDDLGGVALFSMGLARSVTGFTACDLCVPALYFRKVCMRSMRKRFELIFVAIFAAIAADITSILRRRRSRIGARWAQRA